MDPQFPLHKIGTKTWKRPFWKKLSIFFLKISNHLNFGFALKKQFILHTGASDLRLEDGFPVSRRSDRNKTSVTLFPFPFGVAKMTNELLLMSLEIGDFQW